MKKMVFTADEVKSARKKFSAKKITDKVRRVKISELESLVVNATLKHGVNL